MSDIPKSDTGDYQTDALIDEANEFMDEAKATLLDGYRKILLSDFDKYFRGFFMGKVPPAHQAKVGHAWLTFAGSTTAGVNIVDTEGAIIMVVPPLHNTGGIDVTGGMLSKASKIKQLESANIGKAANHKYDVAMADYIEFDVKEDESTSWATFDKWLNGDAEPDEKEEKFDRRSMYK